MMVLAEQSTSDIVPVILAGGKGTRLWPLSTRSLPKQFIPLLSGSSLFTDTLTAFSQVTGFSAPVIAGSDEQRVILLEQVGTASPHAILLEPAPAGTAAAMAMVARLFRDRPGTVLLFLPSDHVVADRPSLLRAIHSRMPLAQAGRIVTFGIHPTRPETGYGYIKPGSMIEDGYSDIQSFCEKPDAATAAKLIGEGWLWNSGMFLLSAATLIEAMSTHQPRLLAACDQALDDASADGPFIIPAAGPLSGGDGLSFDHAVMEHTTAGSVVALDVDWTDAGSWDELWRLSAKDAAGNALSGNVVAEGTERSLIRSLGPLTVVNGLKDVVVINTGSAVLVMPMAEARSMKAMLQFLPQDST